MFRKLRGEIREYLREYRYYKSWDNCEKEVFGYDPCYFVEEYDKLGEPVGMRATTLWEQYRMRCYNLLPSIVRFDLHQTKQHILGLICKYKGHDWVDDSYGGPESGCMAGHCRRCDYSFHTQLY